MTNNEDVLKNIPRTQKEMEDLSGKISSDNMEKAMEKGYKLNEKIEKARRMVKMFESEVFKEFWEIVHDEMKRMTETSVSQIKGDPSKEMRYDPWGQLVQLNQIQGGIEMLESIMIQKKVIEEMAKRDPMNMDELKAKLEAIKTK